MLLVVTTAPRCAHGACGGWRLRKFVFGSGKSQFSWLFLLEMSSDPTSPFPDLPPGSSVVYKPSLWDDYFYGTFYPSGVRPSYGGKPVAVRITMNDVKRREQMQLPLGKFERVIAGKRIVLSA